MWEIMECTFRPASDLNNGVAGEEGSMVERVGFMGIEPTVASILP